MIRSWISHSPRRALISGLVLVVIVAGAGSRAWLWWMIHSGHRALLSGQPETALRLLTRAANYAQSSAEAQYRLAVAERRCGHLNRVAAPLETARRLGWPPDDIERQSLLTIAQGGDVPSVDARLKAIMVRGATDEAAEEIYEALAIGYLKSYRLKEAWECLFFWSEWRPRATIPRFWRADIDRRLNNQGKAEAEYRHILTIDPHHAEARCRLAELLKNSNRVEEAVREYGPCLNEMKVQSDALIGMAECQRRLGQNASAEALLQRAMGLNLSDHQRATVLSQRGEMEADAGRWTNAIQDLEKAVKLAPYETAFLFALSQAYASAGDKPRAEELFKKSQQVRSQQQRVEEMTQTLLKRPTDANLRYDAALILMDLGLREQAAIWLQTTLQINPNHQRAREALQAYYSSLKTEPLPDAPRSDPGSYNQ